jgi:hypothetical protein
MAFTIEDGTGIEDANAYATVAFVDTYFSDRGNTSWTGTNSEKEYAIIEATDYIERRWGPLFKGNKEFTSDPLQALSFPRLNLYDRDGLLVEGIPTKLKQATAEYALRALAGTLYADPSSTDKVTLTRKKIGPIEVETRYNENLVGAETPDYPMADALLIDYVASTGGRSYRA